MAYTTINDPTKYFNTKLYAGDNTTANAITGLGHQPDWLWIKNRSATGDHQTADSVRGKSGSLFLQVRTNTTDAEVVQSDNDGVHSFDSDGFTVGYTNSTAWNNTGNNYVAWSWKAGGTASSNTDGSITSSVSANTTAGFSIVSYTGTGSNATVGHGLGVKPNVIIIKNRSTSQHWTSYWSSQGATKYMRLNAQQGVTTESTRFNDTEPTSSVFSIGTNQETNENTSNIIAYCFTSKQGFSKMGSMYYGNESSDPNFVYLGFKPAFLLVKSIGTTSDWWLADNKRNTFNAQKTLLRPNTTNAESQPYTEAFDFLSNGFKVRASASDINRSSGILFMAFAESPLVTSSGIPTTAR